MIVSRLEATTWQVVTQPDHAAFAADLLSLFRLPELIEHPRRKELLRAVREHDNGWQEADSMPYLDESGRQPLDFRSVPTALRQEIWLRGVERFASESPYIALLVAHHALALHPGPQWEALQGAVVRIQEHCLEESEIDPGEIEADYQWLALADRCALAIAERQTEPFQQAGFRVAFDGERLHLDPFPLAGTTRCRLSARRLEDRLYSSPVDLATALATARWLRIEVPIALA